jgi:signal transduction histidine kinase
LDSIQKLTQISQDRFSDREFGKLFNRMVSEDIHQTDLLLDGLLNYFQVTTPIKKTDTVNTLIEEALKKNQIQLKEKGVKLFKKLEKDLPEIIVPDEHLKYILNSVLQYVIASTPANGNIEFLTKFLISRNGGGKEQASFEEHGGYIEILIVFAGDRELGGNSVTALEPILTIQKNGALELMLRLVKEMVMKNRGIMKFEVDEKKAKMLISFIFPIERRKMAFYELMSINPPAHHLNILDI